MRMDNKMVKTVSLFVVALITILLNLFIGWFVWSNTQNLATTILVLALVSASFFFSPAVNKRI